MGSFWQPFGKHCSFLKHIRTKDFLLKKLEKHGQ